MGDEKNLEQAFGNLLNIYIYIYKSRKLGLKANGIIFALA